MVLKFERHISEMQPFACLEGNDLAVTGNFVDVLNGEGSWHLNE